MAHRASLSNSQTYLRPSHPTLPLLCAHKSCRRAHALHRRRETEQGKTATAPSFSACTYLHIRARGLATDLRFPCTPHDMQQRGQRRPGLHRPELRADGGEQPLRLDACRRCRVLHQRTCLRAFSLDLHAARVRRRRRQQLRLDAGRHGVQHLGGIGPEGYQNRKGREHQQRCDDFARVASRCDLHRRAWRFGVLLSKYVLCSHANACMRC